jgi:hypothetical protein
MISQAYTLQNHIDACIYAVTISIRLCNAAAYTASTKQLAFRFAGC